MPTRKYGDGNFAGALISARVVEVGDKKTPALEFSLRLVYKKNPAGEWEKMEGDHVVNSLSQFFLSDASWPYTEERLKELGFNGDFDNPQFKVFENGKTIELTCQANHKGYDEFVFTNFESGGGSNNPDASKDTKNKFTQRYKDAMTASADSPPNNDLPY